MPINWILWHKPQHSIEHLHAFVTDKPIEGEVEEEATDYMIPYY